MARIKLTKTAVESAQPQAQAVELRDTVVPGFLCKITPAGRRVFMLQYRTNAGERRKPALGQFGELTVEQARFMAQEWLAEVRKGGDPSAAKAAARKAPTMKEYPLPSWRTTRSSATSPAPSAATKALLTAALSPSWGA
jgi:hypothetical protein